MNVNEEIRLLSHHVVGMTEEQCAEVRDRGMLPIVFLELLVPLCISGLSGTLHEHTKMGQFEGCLKCCRVSGYGLLAMTLASLRRSSSGGPSLLLVKDGKKILQVEA